MAAVIEAFNRAGRRLAAVRCDGDFATIGRAWDNDVHLDDPYVSPHHLRVETVESGWRIVDLGSTNGLRLTLSGPRESTVTVASGDAVWVGHTRVVVMARSHPVEPARALPTRSSAAAGRLDRPLPALLLLALALALELLTHYLGSTEPFELNRQWQGLLNSAMLYAVIAGGWSLFGRIFRQESGFFYQLSLLAIMFWGGNGALWLWSAIDYNLDNPPSLQWVRFAIVALALAAWLSLALRNASDLSRRVRLTGAAGFACLYLAFQGFNWLAGINQFRFAPVYDARLMPPSIRFVDGVSPQQFEDGLARVFDAAGKLAKRYPEPTTDSKAAASLPDPASD